MNVRAAAAAIAAISALATSTGAALAAPSDLDPSFGTGGSVTIAGPTSLELRQFAVDPTGRIVAVGQSGDAGWVARFLPNGQPDPSFNGSGQATEQVAEVAGGSTRLSAVAIQPNGQIVVGGNATASDGSEEPVVFRLNADGTRDTTGFGAGDGVRRPPASGEIASVTSLAITPGGQIVVAGFSAQALANPADFEVVFTSNGLYAAGPTGTDVEGAVPGRVLVQPSGKLVFVGSVETSSVVEVFLHRTDAALNDDPTFGDAGTPSTKLVQLGQGASPVSGAADDSLVSGSGILVAGTATDPAGQSDMLVARFTQDGALDTSFGSGGRVLLPAGAAGSNPRAFALSLTLDPSGRIVLAGESSGADGYNRQTVARLTPAGGADGTFAPGGAVSFPLGTESQFDSVALQADGRIVAGGHAYFAGSGNEEGSLVRLVGGDTASGVQPAPAPSTDKFAGASLLKKGIQVSGRFALIRHRCPASAPGFCAISDSLASAVRSSARRKKRIIGHGRATLKPGRSGVVKVKLSRKSLRALAHRRKLVAQLTSTSRDALGTKKTVKATVTLRRARRHR